MKTSPSLAPMLVLVLAAGCARPEPGSADAAAHLPAAQVRLASVRIENLPALTDVTGSVRPVRRATLAAKVMGAIVELPVTLGQRVQAGDLLVKISAEEISARVRQARSQLNMARRDLERERDLLGKNASTPEMVRNLEDRLDLTQAMVREAETMLAYTELRAPFDGVIARKLADTGDLAAPGQPLLEVEDATVFQIEAGIPDSLAARLAVGTPLAIEVPAAGINFPGTLAELSSASDSLARTVQAKISIPAGTAVRSGQFARIQIPGAPVRTVLAPVEAVSLLGQMERVFVAVDRRAVLRLVKTGATRSAAGSPMVEILSGLAEGDRLVLNPPAGLREGQALEDLP